MSVDREDEYLEGILMDDFASLAKQLHRKRNLLGGGASLDKDTDTTPTQSSTQTDSNQEFPQDVSTLKSAPTCPPLDLRYQECYEQESNGWSDCNIVAGGSSHYKEYVLLLLLNTMAVTCVDSEEETIKPTLIYSAGTVRSR